MWPRSRRGGSDSILPALSARLIVDRTGRCARLGSMRPIPAVRTNRRVANVRVGGGL
jgi:hypothetical protein